MEQKTISYKGKDLKTKHFMEISEKERKELQAEYYKKPEKKEVIAQIKKIISGGVKNDKITAYYFRDLMAKVQIKTAKWTVEDVFESADLLGVFKSKVLNSPNTFDLTKPLIKNIISAIQLGGKGYAKMPTKFPIKAARKIIEKYNINNNWYDFSCGWGDRLLAAVSENINYYGSDPNIALCERLNELKKDILENLKYSKDIEIYCKGSEEHLSSLDNKIGLAFSSPPYFDLEDYKIGNQSYKEGITYEDWKNNYLFPTFNNIYQYLIENGVLALNIKNVNDYNLIKDSYDYLVNILHLQFVTIETLENIKRQESTGELHNGDEGIYIFKKVSN